MRSNYYNNINNTQANHSNVRSNSCEKFVTDKFQDQFFKNFNMDIKDDFYDPMNNKNIFGYFDNMEKRMIQNFRNAFNNIHLLLPQQQQIPNNGINTNMNNNAIINTNNNMNLQNNPNVNILNNGNGTVFSKVYCSSYNNLNGQPHEERYQSQSIKQMNNGHNISEAKEAYKNSDGIMKMAYQRGLDDKAERFIREKNMKTGVQNQHNVMRGINENQINEFNKQYEDYSKKCGFRQNYYNCLNSFGPFVQNNTKQLSDGNANTNKLIHGAVF